MQNALKSTVAAVLIPLAVVTAIANFTPAAEVSTTKQLRRDARRISEKYYRNSYHRAINTGIIRRPGIVEDAEEAMDLAELALERGDRNEAARRLAQALVMIEAKSGTREAFNLERSFDAYLVESRGQRLRVYLPLFARIFPIGWVYYNSYEDDYERAIARGLFRRPSRVIDKREAIDLGFEAMDEGRYNEAAIRFAQALVTIEKMQGIRAASNFERILNRDLERQWGQSLTDLPLFGMIFNGR